MKEKRNERKLWGNRGPDRLSVKDVEQKEEKKCMRR